jgi:hypothetical protein
LARFPVDFLNSQLNWTGLTKKVARPIWHPAESVLFSMQTTKPAARESRAEQETQMSAHKSKTVWSGNTYSIRLAIGRRYAIEGLILLGWTYGDGSGSDGYTLSDYFTPLGVYRGPDQHGIEPVLSRRPADH